VMASLDPTFTEADVATARRALVSYTAQLRRLESELTGSPSLPFSEDASEDRVQTAFYHQRVAQVATQVAVYDAEIKQHEARMQTNDDDRVSLERQVVILRDLERMRQDLAVREVGTRINYLDAQRQRLAAERESLRLVATNGELRQEIATARAKRAAYLNEWRSKASEELVAVRREIEKLGEQVRKSERRNSMVELASPAPAVVLDVAIRSVGSVVREAEPLITLVPLDVPQEIEIELDPKDVGTVRVGDKVRLKLEALPFQRHGTIDGEVRVISGDTFQKTVGGQTKPVFRGRVKLGEVSLRDVPPDFRLVPGMTVQAEIRVGERRAISYFLYPILRVFDESLREP
jgi:hemolysin D